MRESNCRSIFHKKFINELEEAQKKANKNRKQWFGIGTET